MKAFDCIGVLRAKLDPAKQEAAWAKHQTGTSLEQQYGWTASAPDATAARPPAPGAAAAAARGFAVLHFKVARCLLPYRHSLEACPGFHVLKVI
jgi:hypothetical protein